MNELIRELAVEAGINFYKKPVLNKDYPELYDGEYCESELEQQQKFAELLIRECMRQVKEIQRLDGVLKNKIGIDFEIDVAKEVLKNFGVEE